MLSAVVADLLKVPGCHVTTTVDHRLSNFLTASLSTAQIDTVADVPAERAAFDRHVKRADVTLIIAPETAGALERRVRQVIELRGRTANCTPAAIHLCGDKWRLAKHLEVHRLPTIPTHLANLDAEDPWEVFDSSCVLKPRDGAGSWLTFRVPQGNVEVWQSAVSKFRLAGLSEGVLLQPYIPGLSLSAGCICHAGGELDIFPVGRQEIVTETLQYQGGRIPAEISDESRSSIESLIQKTCATIPGLQGYVGFDVILPENEPYSPIITEINPRLTTSYVGYRQLCDENLARRLLDIPNRSYSDPETSQLRWKRAAVSFGPDGNCAFEADFQ